MLLTIPTNKKGDFCFIIDNPMNKDNIFLSMQHASYDPFWQGQKLIEKKINNPLNLRKTDFKRECPNKLIEK